MPNEAFCLPGNTSVQEILERQDDGIFQPGFLHGLTLSNNAGDATNDIDIAMGYCRSTVNRAHSYARAPSRLHQHQRDLEFPDSVTKQLDVLWAPGNGGGRSASALTNTTWHCFGIGGKHMKDRLFFHDSATEASVLAALPGGYTAYRRIGSVMRESAAITPFVQRNDHFTRKALVNSVSATNPGASAVTATLGVPTGVVLTADLLFNVVNSGSGATVYGLVTALSDTDDAPSISLSHINGSNSSMSCAPVQVRTNASGQVRYRLSYSDGNVVARLGVRGWFDLREKGS